MQFCNMYFIFYYYLNINLLLKLVSKYRRAMKKHTKLYKHWYLLSLRGFLIITLGVFAIVLPTYEGKIRFIKLFEIFAIGSGLLMIQSAIFNRHHINWQWLLIGGMLDLSFGIMLWLVPEISVKSVILVLAVWFLYTGLLQGVESLVLIHENITNWWFELISGTLSFAIAFILIALRSYPRKEIFFILGIMAILFGIFILISSYILYEPED